MEDDDHLRVSDNNATISNCKVVSLSSEDRLGFGGVFDELGNVVRGSHETVSNFSSTALDDDAWVMSGFDPLLGPVYSFIGSSTYQTPVTENWGIRVQDYDLMA
ncbi:hypothetical protein V5N11_003666 [Cardamine amara subsp. amara]|uniref:Uncharacterized protein n=1 Tax=Cardamine amara subsp. amara TaxID=228776 RepID=A0ABD1AG28_CARAN